METRHDRVLLASLIRGKKERHDRVELGFFEPNSFINGFLDFYFHSFIRE